MHSLSWTQACSSQVLTYNGASSLLGMLEWGPDLLGRPVTSEWGSWRQRLEPPAQAHGFCVSLLPVCRNLNTFSGIFKGKSKTSYDFRLIKDNNF